MSTEFSKIMEFIHGFDKSAAVVNINLQGGIVKQFDVEQNRDAKCSSCGFWHAFQHNVNYKGKILCQFCVVDYSEDDHEPILTEWPLCLPACQPKPTEGRLRPWWKRAGFADSCGCAYLYVNTKEKNELMCEQRGCKPSPRALFDVVVSLQQRNINKAAEKAAEALIAEPVVAEKPKPKPTDEKKAQTKQANKERDAKKREKEEFLRHQAECARIKQQQEQRKKAMKKAKAAKK